MCLNLLYVTYNVKFAVLSFFLQIIPCEEIWRQNVLWTVVMMRMAVLFEMCSDRLIYLMKAAQWPSEQHGIYKIVKFCALKFHLD